MTIAGDLQRLWFMVKDILATARHLRDIAAL